ncbi:MAG: LPS export ABC transporter permease LptF [Xanthomonadaceae bacterium]|jgi:lipopolysaccharide export system permease protein|nr:LPS export ABC transporter permease LptF [Xanthomonadaceae bacterium]
MPKLDRYLLSDFTQSFLATLTVLLVVSLGGVLVDILGSIADGKLPARLMLSQLGLQLLVYFPVVLPLALMLGLLLAFGRLYRDSEMAVLNAIGVGPKRMLRPLMMIVVPVVVVIGACSLWLGPWAQRTSERLIEEASRSLVIAGLEAGQFTSLPNGGIIYVDAVSEDGAQMQRVFAQRWDGEQIDVVTSQTGQIWLEGERNRFLRLEHGFRISGPKFDGLNFKLMRFVSNDMALPERADRYDKDDPQMLTTGKLLGDARASAAAELHSRITPPLLALAFALLTLPLSRSSPRQQRYGRVMLGFLAYLVCMNLSFIGADALANGKLPAVLGLWWLTLPLLTLALWFYLRDGRLARNRRKQPI